MNKFFYIWAFLFFILTSAYADDPIQLLSEDSPPYNYVKDGQFVGPAVKIMNELKKRVGNRKKIEVLPWNRAYKMALTTENTALFLTARTPSREKLFHWLGPIVSDQWGFLARHNFSKKITSLSDAQKVSRIGSYLGDVKDEFLKQHKFGNIDTALNNQTNARKLAAGRIDLWIVSIVEYKLHLENENLDPKDFKIVYKFEPVDLYLAFSSQTQEAIVQKWRNAYNSMVTDKTIEKLFPHD